MKRLTTRHYLTTNNLLFLFFALCLIIVVYSCKKENSGGKSTAITNPAVLKAKSWYEKIYPSVSKTNLLSVPENPDLSQLVSPDWSLAKNYTRYDDDVLELPLNDAAPLNFDLSNNAGLVYNNKYSRSWFLLLNKFDKYSAYIMTIIADSGYIKNNPDKLKLNSYNKHEANFTGIVLYSTLQGKYVNGWFYKNGIISGYLPPGQTTETGNGPTVQNIKTNALITVKTCQDFVQKTYYNGQLVATTVLATYCTNTTVDDGTGNGGGGNGGNLGGGGGGGGSSGGSPNTPQCNIPYINDAVKTVKVNSLQTQQAAPPDDGGFPPPADPIPCPPPPVVNLPPVTVPNADIKDSINAKYPCARALIGQLTNLNSDIARILYQAFGSTNGKSITFFDGTATDFPASSKEDGNTVGYRILINPFVLSNSTNEYRLVTFYHEAIHAFLNMEIQRLGSDGFSSKYPEIKVKAQPTGSGNVNDRYYYTIDEGATVGKIDKDPQHRTMAEYFTDSLRDAILAYNPQFPRDRATALARYGLFDDTSITYYNNAERDVRNAEFAGTKCTP